MTETFSALLGAVVGAVMTFAFTQIAHRAAQKEQRKLHVFAVLMGGRGRIATQEVADAMNLIPVVFYEDQEVRRAYQHFCALVPGSGDVFFTRYVDMVLAIAKNLGYDRNLTPADVNLGFYPAAPRQGPTGPEQPDIIEPKRNWWPF